jgi:cytochrome c oxidase subunit IV
MTSIQKNAFALAVLIILLGVTLAAAYLDLGVLHTPAAMLIGLVKAVLIVLIFMRLRPSGPLVMLAFAAGLFWLLIMFTLTLGDYFTRA